MNVHILFGESAAGGLKWTLEKMGKSDKVIGFPYQFAVGPIFQLETEAGLTSRVNWLIEHMPKDEFNFYYEREYEELFRETLREINEIPDYAKITIWTAGNAPEQTGLRFVVKLLEDRPNPILVVNTNEIYDKYCKNPEIYYVSLHTGEIAPKDLQVILEKTRNDEHISSTYKKQLVREWEALSNSKEVLRLWENGEIRSVRVDHLDSFIINIARHLECKYGDDFKKSARLIGDVIGHLEQYVGDDFIQYRLLHLINQGVFEYEGNLVGMRNYSVKLAKR